MESALGGLRDGEVLAGRCRVGGETGRGGRSVVRPAFHARLWERAERRVTPEARG